MSQMKNNIRIIMNALSLGIPVEMGGRTYRLFKKGDEIKLPSFTGEVGEGYWLGVEMQGEGNEKPYLGIEMSFTSMLALMDSVSEEDLVGIAGSTVLTEIEREKRRG